MLKKYVFLVIMFSIGVILLAACNLPFSVSAPTQVSQDSVYTQAAQTIEAEFTQTAEQQMASSDSTPISTSAATVQPPTETPIPATLPATSSPTLQATQTPTLTNTPSVPMISATVNTNCREGPSKYYRIVGMLGVDEQAEVHGRDSGGFWWYIQNLKRPGEFCWVWDETTQVAGDISGLAVITPPPPPATPTHTPTPGPGFSVSYSNMHDCGGNQTAIYQVSNSGTADLDSMTLKIEDITDGVVLFGPSSSDAPFMGSDGECPPGGDLLKTGKTLFVGGAIGAPPSGNTIRAWITLCTENGLGGTCVDRSIDFTMP